MIAVFIRRDLAEGDQKRTGHGYSVALVKFRSKGQLRDLAQLLGQRGLPEPFDHPYPWYGGLMDLAAVLPGNRVLALASVLGDGPSRRRISVGDHRYVGLYDAKELLA